MTETAKAAPATTEAEGADKVVENVADRLKFFFSDSNVRQDTFLRKLLLKEDGTAGLVPVEKLLKFNTIKKYTEDAAVVVKAAKTLPDLLSLSEDESEIGLVVPFTKDKMQGHIPVTLYVQNLPVKEVEGSKQYSVTLEDVRSLFGKYGEIALIKLRYTTGADDLADSDFGLAKKIRKKRTHAIGHAMVEFAEKEGAEKAAAATLTKKAGAAVEPTDKLTMGDNTLDVMLFSEYLAERKKECKAASKKRKADDEAAKDSEEKSESVEFEWKPKCIVQIKGLADESSRESLLEAVGSILSISEDEIKNKKIYFDYSRGQPDGAIRFAEPGDDVEKVATELKSGNATIGGSKVDDCYVLEGDEEKEYYKKFFEFKAKQQKHRMQERGHKRPRWQKHRRQ